MHLVQSFCEMQYGAVTYNPYTKIQDFFSLGSKKVQTKEERIMKNRNPLCIVILADMPKQPYPIAIWTDF